MSAEDTELVRRAWRTMSEIALDHDRKVAVSDALGLSWARVLALRALAMQPHTCARSPTDSRPTRRTSR
jgi:hypothetical protein